MRTVDLSVPSFLLLLTTILAAGTVCLSIAVALVEDNRAALKEWWVWGLSISCWVVTLIIACAMSRLSIFNEFYYGPLLVLHTLVVTGVFRVTVVRATFLVVMAFGMFGTSFLLLGFFYEFFLRAPR